MSMKDWDFGYFGKGLDGYVHFRQGMEEIESHSPPLRRTSSAAPPKSGEKSPAKSAPEGGRKMSDWLDNGFAVSMLILLFFIILEEIFQTEAGDYAAMAATVPFPVFPGIEVIRFVIWLFKSIW